MRETGGVIQYMQNGRKPTREQKKVLSANKMETRDWLYIKQAGPCLVFRHRQTGEEKRLDRL